MSTPITYRPGFLPAGNVTMDRFDRLWSELDWVRVGQTPRREYYTSVLASPQPYTYGVGAYARTYRPQPMRPDILHIWERAEQAADCRFDVCFLNGYEDTDLCMRLRAAGYRHYVSTRSMVFHHVSASPGRHDRETENRTLYLQRWKNAGVQLHAEKDAHWRDLQSSLKKSRFFQFRYYFQFH